MTTKQGKRIAIITERIAPFYRGGAEEVLYRYTEILAKRNDVSVFTSFDFGAASKKIGNVNFNYISRSVKKNNRKGNHSILGVLSFSFALLTHKQLIKDFDIVILDSIHYFYPKCFLKFLKFGNYKIVTIFHEAWYEYRKHGGVSPILSYLMGVSIYRLIRYSNKLISVSDPTTNSLIKNYKVRNENIVTIPLGIDYKDIIDRQSHRNFAERPYDIVFVGRFAAIKRIDDIVEAISILSKKGMNLTVALIGDGSQMPIIKSKIESLGLRKCFKIFGFLDDSKKYSILSKSKIFILPSEREGFSLSTLEAMAFGCVPVVGKPKFEEVFGTSHFVKNGVNGLYYPTGDINELALTIIKCLKNQKFANLLSSNAIEISNKYTISEMEKKICEALNGVPF